MFICRLSQYRRCSCHIVRPDNSLKTLSYLSRSRYRGTIINKLLLVQEMRLLLEMRNVATHPTEMDKIFPSQKALMLCLDYNGTKTLLCRNRERLRLRRRTGADRLISNRNQPQCQLCEVALHIDSVDKLIASPEGNFDAFWRNFFSENDG